MVAISIITYWCYISAVVVQFPVALCFMAAPPLLVAGATDSYAHLFIRVTGICLLALTQVFWGFRHIPFQAQGGVDAQLALYSMASARMFARFHTLMAGLLGWAMWQVGLGIPSGRCLLGLHIAWVVVMVYALLQHHRYAHGHIIDTTSVPAAAKSLVHLVKGEDEEPRSMLQIMKGEDSSSKSILKIFQDEIKTD